MDKVVKQYTLAKGTTYEALISDVNALIANGWQPFGGVSSSVWTTIGTKEIPASIKGSNEQAMVKY